MSETTVYIDVEQGTRGKEVQVTFRPKNLKVVVRGETVIDGAMGGDVLASECIWSLDSNRTIVLSMEKKTQTWWRCVVEGDPKIDATKVDSTQQVSDYDEETQGAIRKIMVRRRTRGGVVWREDHNKLLVCVRAQSVLRVGVD